MPIKRAGFPARFDYRADRIETPARIKKGAREVGFRYSTFDLEK